MAMASPMASPIATPMAEADEADADVAADAECFFAALERERIPLECHRTERPLRRQ
jgi:hypothetical protein